MAIIYGGADAFDAVVYGEQSHHNTNFFRNQMQMLTQPLISANLVFVEKAKELYERFEGSDAMKLARSALRAVSSVLMRDTVYYHAPGIHTQMAQPVMQRWIMANPMIRQMYHEQKLDGYSESYMDVDPGKIGEAHYDYRRVMDGVLVFGQGEEDWWRTEFIEETHDWDLELGIQDKADIIDTWSAIEAFVKGGSRDPTSVWNTKL